MKPNGAPPLSPRWSPQQRILWMKLKQAPPDALMVYQSEFAELREQMERAIALQAETTAAIAQLDAFGYWQTEPDLKNAAGAAAFDGRRYERATTAAIDAFEFLLAGSDAVLNAAADAKVRETLAFLKAQRDGRRERIK